MSHILTAVPFSKQAFIEACVSRVRRQDTIARKSHTDYLVGYLEHLQCRTIVVESEYVDRDFLDDFAAYYVRCFTEYPRFCTRLHFFSHEFSNENLAALVQGSNPTLDGVLVESYLGHIVLKPLPDAFYGRTCLATYSDEKRRRFPMVRSYRAHLAGIPLTVRSLAFQEQDTILAACATSALWSALQKAARLFGTRVPTTAEITGAAGKNGVVTERILPSRGLNVFQMCQAIREAGLDFEIRQGENLTDLKGLVHGYGSFGIPIILGMNLTTESGSLGGHAVTVAGFSVNPSPDTASEFAADRVEKLFVHDDQVGPFARAEIIDSRTVESPFPNDSPVKGELTSIIIPVDKKIRIRYEEAKEALVPFLRIMQSLNNEYEWDIQLSTSNRLRGEIFQKVGLSERLRERVLTENWPKYVWRATARLQDADVAEVVFDATGIHRAHFVADILFYNNELAGIFRDALTSKAVRERLTPLLGPEWLLQIENSAAR